LLQASGSNKAGPFERKLTALYTRATLEAGADLDGLTKAAGDGALSSEQLSSFLLCIVEEPGGGGGGGGSGGGRGARIAVVAVEPSSGDVLYDCFVDSPMRTELEVSVLRRKWGKEWKGSPQSLAHSCTPRSGRRQSYAHTPTCTV